jgi:FixJ family two-component response regulator
MIYLIDDDKSISRAFGIFLRSADFEFLSFESAEEFLNAYVPGGNDILVLDLQLPGMNGCDLLRKLHADNFNIPVVVATAFDDTLNRECCRQHGVKAFLRKPVDAEVIIDMIKYHVVI